MTTPIAVKETNPKKSFPVHFLDKIKAKRARIAKII